MIIDCNAHLGPYPFRRLRSHTPESMIALMDRNGIDRAVVSWLPAIFYRDAHSGNEELHEHVQRGRDRFIPVATINPKYVGWQRDLDQAIEQWRMKAVALTPSHHGYSLTDEFGQAVLKSIAERGVPAVLSQRFEDRRQRHHWDAAEDLETKTLIELAQTHPKLKLMLSNWINLDGARLAAAGWKGRCLIDFARLHVLLYKDVDKLIETLGVESIAFGSHMPFDYVGPSLVKLSNLEKLPPADFEKITHRNAIAFFGL